jgi:hypothetical protein
MAGKVTTSGDINKALHSKFSTQSISFTADDTDGSIESETVGPGTSGAALDHPVLERVEYVPGATAPTAAADFTITNEDGFDLLEGDGANVGDAQTNINVNKLFTGPLTFAFANNAVNSATGTFRLYYKDVN